MRQTKKATEPVVIEQKAKKRKLSEDELNQRVLYFAYGSNMHKPRLEWRVGEVLTIGAYNLPNFALTFDCGNPCNAFANIIHSEGNNVEGVIYEMSYRQLRLLDKYELFYSRQKDVYNERKLHYYISIFRNTEPEFTLDVKYWACIRKGCIANNLQRTLRMVDDLFANGNVSL